MAEIVQFQTRDVDEQAEALSGFRQFYEQLGRGRFHGSVWQLMMSGGALLRESSNRGLRERFSPPPEHLTLAVPLAVGPGSVFAGRPLERESLLVLDGHEEYELVTAGEFDIVGLSVHEALLAELAPAKAEWLRRAQRERHLQLSPDAASAIRLMLMAVGESASHEIESLGEGGQEAALLSSTLIQAVVLAMASERAEAQTIPRRADTRVKVVRRALDFMRAHLYEDIGIAEICAAACASRRTLQYCFEEFMHTTPQACLRVLRLNEARRALKARADQPITALASELGFASASHFTRHYKLMFDELPSETLKAYGMNGTGLMP